MEFLNQLNLDQVKQVFRNNYECEEISSTIQKLIDLRLIEVEEKTYVKCVNRNDDDFLDLTEDQKMCSGTSYIDGVQDYCECDVCGRRLIIANKEKFKNYSVSINYDTVINLLIDKIGNSRFEINRNNAHIEILDEMENKRVLCILDLCDNVECKSKFYYSDSIIYIYCDKIYGNIQATPNIIWFFDFLTINSDQIIYFIKDNAPLVNSNKIRTIMANYIDTMSWQEFEDFIPRILNYIREHPNKYNEGLTSLQKHSGTIFSSFSIKLGGSGRTDAYSINLLDYLCFLLKPDISIEVKHSNQNNIKNSIRRSDLRELMDHAYQKEGVIITNRKNIDAYVMDRCIQLKKENNGNWKYIVIHRPLLILFISLFIKDFWDDPEVLL
ncbi:MAG: hypothetical protein ACTSVV_05410 [Promethearchaeota archaeon]